MIVVFANVELSKKRQTKTWALGDMRKRNIN